MNKSISFKKRYTTAVCMRQTKDSRKEKQESSMKVHPFHNIPPIPTSPRGDERVCRGMKSWAVLRGTAERYMFDDALVGRHR